MVPSQPKLWFQEHESYDDRNLSLFRKVKINLLADSMKKSLITIFSLLFSVNSLAALEVGDTAPDFSTQAALAGEAFEFSLEQARSQGPVVVYFYPKAFTSGCTVQAHLFAEASDEFAQYNTTIIGVSSDELDTLQEFSVKECGNKFAVAADPDSEVIKAYDVGMMLLPGMASRISFVVAPNGEIIHVHDARSPAGHIETSLAAVKSWSMDAETDL